MHSAIILLASAALLFSGAAAQATAGQTQAIGEQSCDPAAVTAEPPCPFGKWCPGSGKCPPNPCLTFPCVNGHCELTKPDDGPQGNQLPAPHTPMCVCNEGFHSPTPFVSNSCVPDVPQPCCDTKECPVCYDGHPAECVPGDTPGTCSCKTVPGARQDQTLLILTRLVAQ